MRRAILRTRDLCVLLGVHENTLYRRIARGDVPPYRRTTGVKRRYEWKVSDVERYLGVPLRTLEGEGRPDGPGRH